MILVATAPGRGYLAETLASLDREGGADVEDKVVVSDGPVDRSAVRKGWGVVELAKSNRLEAGWSALLTGRQCGTSLLAFEDDIVVSPDGVRRMLAHSPDQRTAFTSFFSPLPPPGYRRKQPGPPRSDLLPVALWRYSQALLYPAASLAALCDTVGPATFVGKGPSGFDGSLAQAVPAAGLPALVEIVWPNYVQHVGRVSLVAHAGTVFPHSPWWAGS